MTGHSTDPDVIARQSATSDPQGTAPDPQSTVQANPSHVNPRPDHPGPVNPVTPAYSGSRGSPDDLEPENVLGPQPGEPTFDPAYDRDASILAPRDLPLDPPPDHQATPDRSDADLLRKVHERLGAHPLIDSAEIEVAVQNGCVTLTGIVRHPDTIQNAATCLAPLPGITSLLNELRTSPFDRTSASQQDTTDPGKSGF